MNENQPRRPGRPPGKTLPRKLTIRCDDTDLARLRLLARLAGRGQGPYLRQLLRDEALRQGVAPAPPPEEPR